jgi:hypothetical protein
MLCPSPNGPGQDLNLEDALVTPEVQWSELQKSRLNFGESRFL